MKNTVFVDFDGTICFNRFWEHLPAAEYQAIQAVLFNPDNGELIREWMRGKHSMEDICVMVSRDTGLSFKYLLKEFTTSACAFSVSETVLELIQQLRDQFHVVLITGNMDSFHRYTALALKLESYFDVIANSWEVGLLKTDDHGSIFRKFVRGAIEDSYLIEDSAASCETFCQLGGTALQVTHETSAEDHIRLLLNNMQRAT